MASAAEWAKRVTAWQRSGLSAGDFADKHGYAKKSLQWWAGELRRRERQQGSDAATEVRLARVVRPGEAPVMEGGPIVVRIGRMEVVVHRGFDAGVLAEVLAAIGTVR